MSVFRQRAVSAAFLVSRFVRYCRMWRMRRVLAICLVLGFLSCSKFDEREMFVLHVAAFANDEIKGLRGGKVSCLHCPMYFAFDAPPVIVGKVVSEHQMRRVVTPPKLAREVEDLVQREASWWLAANPKAQDEVYWVSYSPKLSELEPAFRLLVVKGTQAFFITSGYFASEYYVQDQLGDVDSRR